MAADDDDPSERCTLALPRDSADETTSPAWRQGEAIRTSRREVVIVELKKQGQSQRVQAALAELPAKVDQEQQAALLEKFGLDPGKLAERAAEAGIADL